jgi:opacity protein-like surface antigen
MKMSDSKEADKTLDRFSQYMQQRLKDHPATLDANGWEELQAKLYAPRKRNLPKAAIWIAAAALVALTLVNIPWQTASPPMIAEAPAVIETPPAIPAAAPIPQPTPQLTPQPTPQPPKGGATETLATPAGETPPPAPQESDDPTADVPQYKTPSPRTADYPPQLVKPKTKTGGTWFIAAAISSGGGAPSLQNILPTPGADFADAPAQNSPSTSEKGLYTSTPILPPEFDYILPGDFTDVSYALPISFAVTVRKNISPRVAVESGLIYTRLLTKMHMQAPRYDARLQLHYLGVPLRIVADLWNDGQWTVYAAGGLTVEKGLRSVYTQDRHVTEGVMRTTVSTGIKSVQLSMGASLGVSCKLSQEWSLYAEPRFAHYFDSGQPISVRTEHPLAFELAAGLRYAFGNNK